MATELTESALQALDRRELQALCKTYNIKANAKNSLLIEALLDVAQNGPAAASEEDCEDATSRDGTPDAMEVDAVEASPIFAVETANRGLTMRSARKGSSLAHEVAAASPSPASSPSLLMQGAPQGLDTMPSPTLRASMSPALRRTTRSPATRAVMDELDRRVQEAIQSGAYASLISSTPVANRTPSKLKPGDKGYWDEAHARGFDQMDSIASHYSARRTPGTTRTASSFPPAASPSLTARLSRHPATATPSRSAQMSRAVAKTPAALVSPVVTAPPLTASKLPTSSLARSAAKPATAAAAPRVAAKPASVAAKPASVTASRLATKAAAPAKPAPFFARPAPASTKPLASRMATKVAVPRPVVKPAPPVAVSGRAVTKPVTMRPTLQSRPAPRAAPAPAAKQFVARPAPVLRPVVVKQMAPRTPRKVEATTPAKTPLPRWGLYTPGRIEAENIKFDINAIPPSPKASTAVDAPVLVAGGPPKRVPPPPRPKFDLKASLAKPLSYKPHAGVIGK